MAQQTVGNFEYELKKIQLCIAILMNEAEFSMFLEFQREAIEGLNRAVHDLERLWISLEDYHQLQPEEQSRWRHDLGNPINGLLGLSEVMMLDSLADHHRHCLHEINQRGKQIYHDIKSTYLVM